MKREDLIAAIVAELGERAGRCDPTDVELAARVADRLGVIEEPTRPSIRVGDPLNATLARSIERHTPSTAERWLFVRQQTWIPTAIASRFDGVILTARTSRGRTNRSRSWCQAVLEAGTKIALVDLMLPPGAWRTGLAEAMQFARDVGAIAYCLDVEPTKENTTDWRDRDEELRQYSARARDLCSTYGLGLWATGWAMPSQAKTFPWSELLAPADRAIVQCYEVHGRAGRDYVERCMREYREHGARDLILGRGAHELDRGDADAWRTPAQITTHRQSTPAGMSEAWWCPGGPFPPRHVDAMLDAMLAPIAA